MPADLLKPKVVVIQLGRSFVDTVAQRVMDNEDIARRFFDDEEFKQVLVNWYADQVYRKARE